MKKWLTDHWFEIFSLIILIGGSAWYLYFANGAMRVTAIATFLLTIVVIFSCWKELREAGSDFPIIMGFKFIIGGAITIAMNIVAIAINAIRLAIIASNFEFFAQQKFWAEAIGSNCLIILLIFVIPNILINMLANDDGAEEADLSYYAEGRGFPH